MADIREWRQWEKFGYPEGCELTLADEIDRHNSGAHGYTFEERLVMRHRIAKTLAHIEVLVRLCEEMGNDCMKSQAAYVKDRMEGRQ